MSRTVRIEPEVDRDLREIAGFISHRVSPTSAARWLTRILKTIRSLADNAAVWPEADESARLGRNIRCRLFGRGRHVYRVLFALDDETVKILRVRHASQDWLSEGEI